MYVLDNCSNAEMNNINELFHFMIIMNISIEEYIRAHRHNIHKTKLQVILCIFTNCTWVIVSPIRMNSGDTMVSRN